jgi:glyoxylate utilization-related uncharacterized protein
MRAIETMRPATRSEPGECVVEGVFPGRIEGVILATISLGQGARVTFPGSESTIRVLLLLDGEITIDFAESQTFMANLHTVRVPYAASASVGNRGSELCRLLSIERLLSDEDCADVKSNLDSYRSWYAVAHSDCPRYSESIKGEKTINTMMLNEGIVPRFCMGSVEAVGPDRVQSHSHPMLDQVFMGLSRCSCRVDADDSVASLQAGMFLHVPLGSTHSVSVSRGAQMRYVWMDFFQTTEGQSYMGMQHTLIEAHKE